MILSTISETLITHKAKDVQILDVRDKTPFIDTLIICTATSNRHAKSIAEKLVKAVKAQQILPVGVEGLELGEWILVNLDSVVAHIMLADKRELYQLDKIWIVSEENTEWKIYPP
jgi:ribosome-associated protein